MGSKLDHSLILYFGFFCYLREFGPCGASEWRTSMSIAFLRFCSVLHLALHFLEGYLVYTNICFYGRHTKPENVANALCASGCSFHYIVGSNVVFMLLFSRLPALQSSKSYGCIANGAQRKDIYLFNGSS